MKRFDQLAFYVIAAAMIVPSACTAVSDGNDPDPSSQGAGTGEVRQALTGTQKLCSGFIGGNWRDTIEVSDGWSISTCLSWTQSIGALQSQLGCLSDTGFSWGALNGGIPSPNCGWLCAHSVCNTGVALTASCDTCANQICAVDSFCCNNSWDSVCVGEVSSICKLTCN